MRSRFLFLLLVCAAPAGCGWAEWPPPGNRPRDVNRPPAMETSNSGALVVTAGSEDTVYILSRRHGVSMRAIIDANNLTPPYRLTAGQRIILPGEIKHLIVRGDTLSGISIRYNIGMYELARINDLKPPFTIIVGKWLHIPKVGGGKMETAPAAPPEKSSVVAVTPPEKSSVVTVAPLEEAPAANNAPVVEPLAKPEAVPDPPPKSGKRFLWPVKGTVLSDFGPKAKGLHNDGVNIAAPRGAPVMAAENGVVAYAGNEIRGFGFLLLIKHADDWVTAYAHNETLLVARGQQVSKGQVIARVGSTGSVAKPQLHFEIRKGKRAVNPQSVELINSF
ncbi:MAG: hypothetical protein A3G18_01175 [Rhodospirillales bacterium RIFCSPLOWO2_12_FULL_58_28]|nr:MAG: hypothetical protein A3H92_04375 [Rhodospirillales bacterium RIFCSPLOWO2_02_FULL_58_16]OHC78015.1 MAG: hypothetical protein A3G18_01175 [Rhodospirillales bacterium RIFCSPLOWO2_12_FULL_58_28]